MPASTIIVQHHDGSAAKKVRVVLGFATGNTDGVYTDGNGRAVVEHSAIGKAAVYVNGKQEERFSAPGKCVVTLD